jgi:pimeloyl-ACP methyl ester carboxylesterase
MTVKITRREFTVAASQAAVAIQATAISTASTAATASPGSTGVSLPRNGIAKFAQINGIRLHYVTVGTGPAVILLHGWPQTWFAWRGTMERLASRFTVIAPDLRGVGLSERTPAGYDKRTIAEDVRALIAHAAGDRAHVVAHDMGGKAAYMLAHLHPQCVQKLVLVDCLVPGTENADALRGGAWHYGFHMAPQMPEMLTKGREREYITAQIRSWSHNKNAVTEAAISEFTKHYATPGGMTAGFNYYRTLPEDAELAASLEVRKLDLPILAIAGRHGVGTKLADALLKRASDLTSVIAQESGHFVAEEAPDFFCDQVKQFLMT